MSRGITWVNLGQGTKDRDASYIHRVLWGIMELMLFLVNLTGLFVFLLYNGNCVLQ